MPSRKSQSFTVSEISKNTKNHQSEKLNSNKILVPHEIWATISKWNLHSEKLKKPEKNPRSKARTRNNLNPHMAPSRNQTRATLLVGGERSHNCAIPSPPNYNYWSIWLQNWDLILLCFRTQENPVLWDTKDCSWRSEARFLHENTADNSQSCR